MIASHVTRDVLEAAASQVGVRLDVTTINRTGTRHRVKVNSQPTDACYRVAVPRDGAPPYRVRYADERGDAPWQRLSVGYGTAGRRVFAVCWHGFAAFFRAVYVQCPDATFRTAVDTWRNRDDFYARFQQTAYRNIGPRIQPVRMAAACRCPWSGYAGMPGQSTKGG